MSLNIYLTFNGNCKQAFEFYKSAFDSDYIAFQTFADAPDTMKVPEDEHYKVMHVSLPVGESVLMGSDSCEAFNGEVICGQNFAISYTPTSRKNGDSIFAKISDGGIVQMPLQDTFWGSYFGQCQDKFGINWMFNMDISNS